MDYSVDEAALSEFTSHLIRQRSVLGDEGPIASEVFDCMRRLGFDHVEVDRMGNVVGTVVGDDPGPSILFDAHLDTVDAIPEEAWTRDPFGGEIAEGRVFGRGATDMKGALAAMIYGIAGLDRRHIKGQALVVGSVGEEVTEGSALQCVISEKRPDFVVIGEASEMNLVRAGRGRAEFAIQTVGKPCHASTPWKGVNAVHLMMSVIAQIESLPLPRHDFVGEGTFCLTDIISVPFPAQSVVPSGCRVTYERRLVPGDSLDSVGRELQEACDSVGSGSAFVELAEACYESYTGVRIEQPKWYPPWEIPETHALVQNGLRGLKMVGLKPKLTSYQFCTNAAYSSGLAGIPTVGFGPSSERLAHVINEYLELRELFLACLGYRGIATAVLSGSTTMPEGGLSA